MHLQGGNPVEIKGLLVLQAVEHTIAHEGKDGKASAGAYRYFRIVNPDQPTKAMLAAILPLGDRTAFVKLLAPADKIDELTPQFVAFCDSLALASAHS